MGTALHKSQQLSLCSVLKLAEDAQRCLTQTSYDETHEANCRCNLTCLSPQLDLKTRLRHMRRLSQRTKPDLINLVTCYRCRRGQLSTYGHSRKPRYYCDRNAVHAQGHVSLPDRSKSAGPMSARIDILRPKGFEWSICLRLRGWW